MRPGSRDKEGPGKIHASRSSPRPRSFAPRHRKPQGPESGGRRRACGTTQGSETSGAEGRSTEFPTAINGLSAGEGGGWIERAAYFSIQRREYNTQRKSNLFPRRVVYRISIQ